MSQTELNPDYFHDAKKTLPPELYYKLVTPGGGELPEPADEDVPLDVVLERSYNDFSISTTTEEKSSERTRSTKDKSKSSRDQSEEIDCDDFDDDDVLSELEERPENPDDWQDSSSSETEKVQEINIADLKYDVKKFKEQFRQHIKVLPRTHVFNPHFPKHEIKKVTQRPLFILPSLTILNQAFLIRIRELRKDKYRPPHSPPKKKLSHHEEPEESLEVKRCQACNCMCPKKVTHKCTNNGFTFGTKPTEKEIDPDEVLPGPLDYDPNYKYVIPSQEGARIIGRPKIKSSKNETPGPNLTFTQFPHCLKCYGKTFGDSTRFENDETESPGPMYNLQDIQGIGTDSKMASLKSRNRIRRCFSKVPMANLYGLTRFGPAHSQSPLLLGKPCDPVSEIPGPNAYYITEHRSIRGQVFVKPKQEAPKKIKIYSVPGPNRYKLPKLPRGPKFTFGMKTYKKEKCTDITPGPNYGGIIREYHPVTMTFKPFPPKLECPKPPGPMTYKGGEQALKTKPRQPAPIITNRPRRSYYNEC